MTPEELDAIETRANSDTSVEEWLEDTYALIAEVRRLRGDYEPPSWDHRGQADRQYRELIHKYRERAEAAEARVRELEEKYES